MEEPDPFPRRDAVTDDGESLYALQSRLVAAALAEDDPSLDSLLAKMREAGPDAASLYLCGGRLDHDHAFGSRELGFLLSALPEDGAKCAVPGYHPASTEIQVVFQGSLVLEELIDGAVTDRPLARSEVHVIPPGRCHRVRRDRDRRAAAFVVKTNLVATPGVVRCADCDQVADPVHCPLRGNWEGETARFG